MTIVELIAVAGPPRGASEIQGWQCWPPGSVYVDWGTDRQHTMSAVVADQGQVLLIERFADRALRWIEPAWAEDFINDCIRLNIDVEDSGLGPWTECLDPQTILRTYES